MTHVAFLGLGAIGCPIAARLAAVPELTLTVWNRTGSRAEAFAHAHGAHVAPTPADAVRAADVVITCLTVSADVEGLLDGETGLLGALRPDAVVVDCTSGDPAGSRRIAARLAARGVAYLDAPVSGGTTGAAQGTLTIMVGGDRSVLERVRPVLERFGTTIVHCGDIGAGDAVKAVNNALLAIHIWSAGEGLVALAALGVRPDVALEVINRSSGRSNASMNLFPERVLTRAFPRTFRLALLEKDIGIAAAIAREAAVPAPVLQLAADLFRIAHGALGDDADHVETVTLIERWAGREIA